MEAHWEEGVVAFHPVISGVNVSDGVGSRVANVLGRVRVGIGGCRIVLGLARVRVRLVDLTPVPLFLPLSFEGVPVKLGWRC
jgi:hypothetical protein